MTLPVVLCHGFTRFDFITNSRYWKEDAFPAFLTDKGHSVHETKVGWASAVHARGASLLDQLRMISEQENAKLNLIGHSMGGLDIRQALVNDQEFAQEHVATVTTLVTPHWGTAVADWLEKQETDTFLTRLGDIIGISFRGLTDLTFESCRKRNLTWAPVEEILYQTIPLRCFAGSQDADDVFWPLIWAHRLIKNAPIMVEIHDPEGEHRYHAGGILNDGLVSKDSAFWYGFAPAQPVGSADYETWNLDHLNFLGWWDPAEWDLWKGSDDSPGRSISAFRTDHKRLMEAVAAGLA